MRLAEWREDITTKHGLWQKVLEGRLNNIWTNPTTQPSLSNINLENIDLKSQMLLGNQEKTVDISNLSIKHFLDELVSMGIVGALIDAYPVKMQFWDFFFTALVVIIITMIASYFPAKKASLAGERR